MATLLNSKKNTQLVLRDSHSFGRDLNVNITALTNPEASRTHAVIAWDGEVWKIKDMSTNGTFINGKRIRTGQYYPLRAVVKIQFGSLNSDTWEVLNIHSPQPYLLPLDSNLPLIELHDIVLLPLDDTQIVIYLSELGQWFCEHNNECSVLYSGNKVGSKDKKWQFIDTKPCVVTAASEHISHNDIHFNFSVSQNEEHVRLMLDVNKETYDLQERSHHYLLLTLARQRLHDRRKKLTEVEQGWVKKDLLIKMLGLHEQHINIQIYRFRKQVSSVLPLSTTLSQIIERRPGELRFVYTNIAIQGGFKPTEKVGLLEESAV